MEAVPTLPMLQFPVKYAEEAIHFNQILKQGIRMYYQEDPESYNVEIQELENLRRSVMNAAKDFSGCSLLKRYYCQLYSLCSRFPLDKMENEIFQWSFGLDESSKTAHTGGMMYEMNSVMYNIATFHMSLGEEEMRNAPKGIKIACTHFQCAAWAFETLSESKLDDFEITSTGMIYLKYIALSQAQECILEKSMSDNRKPNIIAKVSMQVVEYLKVSQAYLEILKKQPKYANLPKVWEPHIKFKMIYYHAITLFYLGMQSEELKKIGDKIAYFEAALEKLTESAKCTKPLEKFNTAWKSKIRDALTFANDVMQGKLTAGKKENDFVFHEKVPPFATLAEAKGASLVKCIPFRFSDPEVAGVDIFQRLVPIEAHQASSIYSEEKAKLLRQIASQIEERNVELESYLASMQLDSFAHDNDQSLNALPQELVECCAYFNSRNAYRELCDAMSTISNAQHEVDMKLGQIESLIMQEEEQEKEFGTISGTKQAPSQILNELKREVKRCKEAHEAAQSMNKNLHAAITTHKDNIAKLSSPLDDLMSSLPSAVINEREGDSEARHEIQRLMKKVQDMKTQRADFESQLRMGLQEDDITRELVVNQGNIEELFQLKLQKHSSIVSVLEQNMSAQPNILKALSEANANYAATRRSINQVRSQRSDSIYSLIASYQAFTNIVEKVEKGKDFYSKMEIQLNKALTRAKSLCKVQAEHREEKLSMNVKRFAPAGYNPSISTVAPKVKESSVPSGPKLKDYLMAGNDVKSLSNPTPPMGSYAQDYSNSSVRPSPVGSEIQENRTINMTGYVPQVSSAQAMPYPSSYSGTNSNQVPSSQLSTHPNAPVSQSSNVYRHPLGGPQSTPYPTPPRSHSNSNQISDTTRTLPPQGHLPQQVPVPQSTAYTAPDCQSNPYQTPAPHQPSAFPTSVPQSAQYQNPDNPHTNQKVPAMQMLSHNVPRPQSLGYQAPQLATHHMGERANSIEHPGIVSNRPNPVPQPTYSQVNSAQARGPIIGYQEKSTVTQSIINQATGALSNYPATQHYIPYQTLCSGSITPQTSTVSSTHQPYGNQVSSTHQLYGNDASQYKGQSYRADQQENATSYPYSAKAALPTTLPYNMQYPSTGCHPLSQNMTAVPTSRFSQPSDIRSPLPTAMAAGLTPQTNVHHSTTNYPNQYQQPAMVHPSGQTGHQLGSAINPLVYQNCATPQPKYPTPSPYTPDSNVGYHAPTHQAVPQDSYSQKYMPQFSSMQVVSSNNSVMANCHTVTGTSATPVNNAPYITTGQYANQRYVPSGFGNYPNWSATNTNTVSFNPMISSIPSPGTQPKINAGPAVAINVIPGIPHTTPVYPPNNVTLPAVSNIPLNKSTNAAKESFSSNLDLLAGIDITQTMAPLLPQNPTEGLTTGSGNESQNTAHGSIDDLSKLEISAPEEPVHQTDETILAKLAQHPKRTISTLDPLSVESVLMNLATETERLSKFVLGLDKKSLNGPTNLELKWNELANLMDVKCTSLKISVSRCYPMKNRFADLLPFDSTRVVLPSSRDDYINASFVRLNLAENSIPFIMTQAPMPHTFAEFWLMVWDNQVETVVCLNIEAEVKGQIYYPTVMGEECCYGSFCVVAKQISETVNNSWIRRTFQVTHRDTKVTKVVLHLQFLTWPPGEMPESPSQFLQFVEEFHALQKQQRNKMRHSVLHCISGTGRSGAFVVLSAFIQHLNQTGCLFDMWALVVELCQQRRSALQDKAYLLFLYSAALYYAQDILMKHGILTDKATFEDNPRHKTHVRHPSADLLTSDLSKMKANLGLADANELGSEAELPPPSTFTSSVIETIPDEQQVVSEDAADAAIQIGGTTLPPNLAASVDPHQLIIDASKKAQKMTKEQFVNPSTIEDHATNPFQELDPLWSQRQS